MSTSEFTQAEFNFAVFWGMAVQAYQATLVSDQTRFDNLQLTQQEQQGLNVFNRSGCNRCHTGAEFTSASYGSYARNGATQPAGRNQTRDTGFFRTGVRPASEDIGVGGLDGFGNPLTAGTGTVAAGSFKTPGIRNVEFTGPYFHNGGQATLEQLVDFYDRGGDFPQGGVGPGIRPLNLNASDRAALVAFMKALSDDRVKYERAPFDHPEICIPVGQDTSKSQAGTSSAVDKMALIPMVGRNGNSVPLQSFDELLQGIGSDGSRAHNLQDRCPAQ